MTASEHSGAVMETINQCVDALRTLAASFEPGRKDSALINDMFEAADDWRDFGELLLRNSSKTNFPGRVQQEEELYAMLQGRYNLVIKNNPDYARLMRLEAHLIHKGNQR